MKTPRVQGLVDDVIDRYKVVTVGAWSCRYILGTFTWSQHSYTEGEYEGNAADFFGPIPILDSVAWYLRQQPNVKAVLWRVKNHFDHVHLDTWPTGIGTPPCKGGPLRVKHKDGTIGRTFNVEPYVPPPIGDYDMTATEFASKLSQEQVKAICNKKGQGGVWVISPGSSDRTTITNYYLSILGTPTNPDWVSFYLEVQTEALANAAINP